MMDMDERNDVSITSQFISVVCERLAEGKRVRRSLPLWGRLHIDRQLPFMTVFRRPVVGKDIGTERLVTSEPAYLFASGAHQFRAGLSSLVRSIARTLGGIFGAFLILEVWSKDAGEDGEQPSLHGVLAPQFRLFTPKVAAMESIAEVFRSSLSSIRVAKQSATAELVRTARCYPTHLPPLLTAVAARKINCSVLGLEVRPIYHDPDGTELFPLVLRELRRGLSRSTRRAFYEFAHSRTTSRPKHFHTLGRRAVVRAVLEVDHRLSEIAEQFDLILQVTPVNAELDWKTFEKNRFDKPPVFQYRPLPADPVVLKRKLYNIPVERVEDPTLLQMFRQKQDELDRQISMLLDVNTPRFMHGSIQLYGDVEPALLKLARQILNKFPTRTRDDSKHGYLSAAAFRRCAEKEIAFLQKSSPEVDAKAQLRNDIGRILLVSRGSMLIGRETRIPAHRAEALLQHEVGTHVLTYFNGKAQPLRLLSTGLAGYEALQEGLAVMAEYLAGGLNRPRLRTLAARVIAAQHMTKGASFVETFRELTQRHDFERRIAFTIVRRAYRGGGLTKDVIYLRGLCQVLAYLRNGGDLTPLFVGKIAENHIAVVRELQFRRVLHSAPLKPRYIDDPQAIKRLRMVRDGLSILDLTKGMRP